MRHTRPTRYLRFNGFTIVELLIVIVVIAVLASIVIVAYSGITQKARESATELGLSQAARKLAITYTETGQYSADLNDAGITVPPESTPVYQVDVNGYCLSYTQAGQSFMITSGDPTPRPGVCTAALLQTPVVASATVTGSQAVVSWGAVPDAVSYELQYRRNGGAWSTVTATSPRTITGLVLASDYDFSVRALGASVNSEWSLSTARKTLPTPVIVSGTDLGCGNEGGLYSWLSASVTWNAASTSYTASYVLEGTSGATYGLVPLTAANPTGTGTLTQTTSTTRWSPDVPGAGTVYLFGVGPNGERSSSATWTSTVHPAFDC